MATSARPVNGKTTSRIVPSGATKKEVHITAPNMKRVSFKIVGTAPYVQNKFSKKAREQMREKQEAGSTATKGKKRDPKDFDECFRQSQHFSKEGWHGIPCNALRAGMVSMCRLVNFKMTLAKLSLFIEADGYDASEGTPLVKISKGKPFKVEHLVRNDSGVADIRARAMFDEWEATVVVRFDADQFSVDDVANLLHRVGEQGGIGEGRADSPNSVGMGWGFFAVKGA